jgi:hypothetical protein
MNRQAYRSAEPAEELARLWREQLAALDPAPLSGVAKRTYELVGGRAGLLNVFTLCGGDVGKVARMAALVAVCRFRKVDLPLVLTPFRSLIEGVLTDAVRGAVEDVMLGK